MVRQNLVFVFYQIVSCLSTNREVNKHHNSPCLKTSFFGFIWIYFATAPDERGVAEWVKALTFLIRFSCYLTFSLQPF